MRGRLLVSLLAGLVFLGLLPARAAAADVCLTIDEAHDTFSPQDRAAALLLLARQFELEGQHVVAAGCSSSYVVSHVHLGALIAITLSGPNGQRNATAHGMEDVPAVYSQMVRSLVRGVPMNAPGIVDRTNVSAAQAERNRVYSDSIMYARLGYGVIFGDRSYNGPAVGMFGYRKELDAFAIDVSFLNFQYKSSDRSYYPLPEGSGGMTGSWLKLEMLRYATPTAGRSVYLGGGLSWSSVNLDNVDRHWDGSGLQGELTAGYELGRTSTIRIFVQTDVGLPFYKVRSTGYAFLPTYPYVTSPVTEDRYAPSLALSVGLGWQRGGKK